MVIGDPSYLKTEQIRPTGRVVRCICLLNYPIPNTSNAESAQIIIPGPQVNRVNDVLVCCMGNSLQATAPGICVAIVFCVDYFRKGQSGLAPGL
jgi:Rab GDP dissociation inhibitor